MIRWFVTTIVVALAIWFAITGFGSGDQQFYPATDNAGNEVLMIRAGTSLPEGWHWGWDES